MTIFAGSRWSRARAEGSPRSWVVKQARPALERFPEYSASTERIAFEARYYEVTAPLDPDSACPSVLWFDPIQCVLVLEDLGDAERLDGALGRGADARAWAETNSCCCCRSRTRMPPPP